MKILKISGIIAVIIIFMLNCGEIMISALEPGLNIASNEIFEEQVKIKKFPVVTKLRPDTLVITGTIKYDMPILKEKKKYVNLSQLVCIFTLADSNNYQIGRISGKPEISHKTFSIKTFPVDTPIEFKVKKTVEPLIWEQSSRIKDVNFR